MRKDRSKIGVVILNYNSSADCQRSIKGLKKQSGVDLDIVIVDNYSTKEERKNIEELSSRERITFIANNRNNGYNGGNNIGIRDIIKKGYKYVVVSNPDMEYPNREYLHKLLQIMERQDDIAVCAGSITTPSGEYQNPPKHNSDGGIDNFGWIRNILRGELATQTPNWIEDPLKSRVCRKLNGCCLLLRASSLKRIGLFDERTFLYGEESILAKQIENAGLKMYYCAETTAIHNHLKSNEGDNTLRLRYWQKSQLIYLKFYSGYSPLHKAYSYLSIMIYFFLLKTKHRCRKRS